MLPRALEPALREQLARSRLLWAADRAAQRPGVYLPYALEAKYPRAGQSWAWHWVFPSPTLSVDPRSGIERRHHLYEQRPSIDSAKYCRRSSRLHRKFWGSQWPLWSESKTIATDGYGSASVHQPQHCAFDSATNQIGLQSTQDGRNMLLIR